MKKKEMFTKKQKHEIYKKSLDCLRLTGFACLAINDSIDNCEFVINARFCEKNLPEIWLCRNTKASSYIFLSLGTYFSYQQGESLNQRELMIMFAIEMTR